MLSIIVIVGLGFVVCSISQEKRNNIHTFQKLISAAYQISFIHPYVHHFSHKYSFFVIVSTDVRQKWSESINTSQWLLPESIDGLDYLGKQILYLKINSNAVYIVGNYRAPTREGSEGPMVLRPELSRRSSIRSIYIRKIFKN